MQAPVATMIRVTYCSPIALRLVTTLPLIAGVAAADRPRFIVPGHEHAIQTLEELHALHTPHAFNACTLRDGILPHATVWTGTLPRQRYGAAFRGRCHLTPRSNRRRYPQLGSSRGVVHAGH